MIILSKIRKLDQKLKSTKLINYWEILQLLIFQNILILIYVSLMDLIHMIIVKMIQKKLLKLLNQGE